MKKTEVLEKLGIKESVRSVYDADGDVIVCTELKIVRASPDGKKKRWEHAFHYDVITGAEFSGGKITVKEFNGASYVLDAKTGKELKR